MNGGRRMTPRGEMSGSGSGPPLFHLPQNLKMMFEPRPPLEFKPPPVKRKMPPFGGVARFMTQFELTAPPPRVEYEDPQKRKARRRQEKMNAHAAKIEEQLKEYDPAINPKATEDAYRTLFVARLSYDTNAKKLRREFEQYGAIKDVKVIQDLEGNPRAYAFIEFEKEEDMKTAYKRADGRKIDGRRILVDVERGRTVRGWRPRRFGGGLGGRKAKEKVDKKKEAAAAAPAAFGGPSTSYSRPTGYGGSRGDSRDKPRDRYGGGGDSRYGGGGYKGGDSRPRDRSRSRDRGGGARGRGGYGNTFSGAYGPASEGPPRGGDGYRGGDGNRGESFRGGEGGRGDRGADSYRGGDRNDAYKYGPGGGGGERNDAYGPGASSGVAERNDPYKYGPPGSSGGGGDDYRAGAYVKKEPEDQRGSGGGGGYGRRDGGDDGSGRGGYGRRDGDDDYRGAPYIKKERY